MKLSIIVPVFNEENTIQEVIRKLNSLTLQNVQKEIIIVNDGSTDTTKQKITGVKKIKFVYIEHKKNIGKGAAIHAGIKKATGDYVLIQDADLEYNPSYIPILLKKVSLKKDIVVYGTRLKRLPNITKEEKTPLFLLHFLGNRFLSLLVSLLYGTWLTDIETGYKLLPRKIFQEIRFTKQGFDFEAEVTVKLLKNKYTIVEVPIKTIPRNHHEGKKLQTFPEGFRAISIIVANVFT